MAQNTPAMCSTCRRGRSALSRMIPSTFCVGRASVTIRTRNSPLPFSSRFVYARYVDSHLEDNRSKGCEIRWFHDEAAIAARTAFILKNGDDSPAESAVFAPDGSGLTSVDLALALQRAPLQCEI